MKKGKSAGVIAIALISTFTLGATPTLSHAEEKPAFFAPSLQSDGNDRIFAVGDDTGPIYSQLGHWPKKICTATNDSVCQMNVHYTLDSTLIDDGENGDVQALAVLAPCKLTTDENCIEGIALQRPGQAPTQLQFERFSPELASPLDAKNFAADPSKNLPAGGNPAIYDEVVDGKVSDKKYMVIYSYQMGWVPSPNRFDVHPIPDTFKLNNVQLVIRPFKEVPGMRWDSLWEADGRSGLLYDFDPGVRISASLRISTEAVGWFKGRLDAPNISMDPLTKSNNHIVITGEPVTVPNFAVTRRAAALNPLEADYANFFGYNKGVVPGDPAQPKIFGYIDHFRNELNDTAQHTNTYWSISSTTWSSQNFCLRDPNHLLGIVTSNAMGYDGTTPTFEGGQLVYHVTGLHFSPDGVTPNYGSYNLILRSDAARCLYGFSSAPISASVSVTSANGAASVATTVVNEKNGWINLQAAGYTYSEKTIKVKFSQDADIPATAPAPTVASPTKSSPGKSSTITCVKGKSSKKVSGIKPACPAGFTKK